MFFVWCYSRFEDLCLFDFLIKVCMCEPERQQMNSKLEIRMKKLGNKRWCTLISQLIMQSRERNYATTCFLSNDHAVASSTTVCLHQAREREGASKP